MQVTLPIKPQIIHTSKQSESKRNLYMSRVYEYGGNSMSSIDEYLDRINKLHRAPTMIQEFPEPPSSYPDEYNDQRVKVHKNPQHQHKHQHQHEYQSPQAQNKVRFTEYEERFEIDRRGKNEEVCEDISIDMEADGFIQRRHKNFESCKTSKGGY